MINFYLIQDLVRSGGSLEVILEEIPNYGTAYTKFPCSMELPTKASLNDFTRVFDWDTLLDEPLMLWSLPKHSDFQGKRLTKDKTAMIWLSHMVVPKNKDVFAKPRGLIYKDCQEFTEVRMQLAMTNKLPLQINRIYTGENMFNFRFKLIGISHIETLFMMYEQECYYNGSRVPKYVSHYPSKKIAKQTEKRIVDYLAPLVKLNETGTQLVNKFKDATEVLKLDKLDLGSKNSDQLEDIKKYFKMPFKPYLILVEFMLFAGIKLISEVQVTYPVPFSNHPKFDLSLVYKELKVCQLPLEVVIDINLDEVGLQHKGGID